MNAKESDKLAKDSNSLDMKLDSSSKDIDSTKEAPKQEEVARARKGFRKFFYYRKTNKLGAVFISIALALMLALPLGNILLWIIFIFPFYIIFYMILRNIVAYQPFLLLLLLYILCVLLFLILWNPNYDGVMLFLLFIFIGTPFVILFILGNILYHSQSILYAVIMVTLVFILFVIMSRY